VKRLLLTAIASLLLAVVTNAQTDQQKQDFISACLAGAIKNGCPTQNTQADVRDNSSITLEQIKARNAAAIIQADNQAAQTRATLQSPMPSPTVTPAPGVPVAPPVETQPAPVTEAPSKSPIAPRRVYITPIGRHTAASCGPATHLPVREHCTV